MGPQRLTSSFRRVGVQRQVAQTQAFWNLTCLLGILHFFVNAGEFYLSCCLLSNLCREINDEA